MESNNKKIAKNTIVLYIRLLVTLLISLYTSRVILQTLGITDYGIYGIVGDVVSFMGFINVALATSSSRFLTYALGEGDEKKSERTFATTLTIHIILGLLIIVIAETLGLWLIYNKLIIPADRFNAAFWAYQFSVLTIAVGVSQVPYSASIVAHEDMNIYAYMSIADAVLRLIIVFLIQFYGSDKLIFFAFLVLVQNIGTMLFYRFYCSRKYKETKFRIYIDRNIFKSIASFSGYSLITSMTNAFNAQGTTILMGMFFNPAIIAAKSLSVKVNAMTTQFIGNFRQAANPQIVKLHAAHEFDKFRVLVCNSGLYSFYIMWIMTLPICLLTEPLLNIWLVNYPDYTIIFVRLIMIDSLFWLFDASFNEGVIANGDLKKITIWTSVLQILRIFIIYILFKFGYSPTLAFVVGIIFGFIIGIILKPYFLHLLMNFKLSDFLHVYKKSLLIAFISSIIPLFLYVLLDINSIIGFIIVGAVSVISSIITIYYLGINENVRMQLNSYVRTRVLKK